MYQEKSFSFSHLKGLLSENTLNEHYKLYQGYVKNTNYCLEVMNNPNLDSYTKNEIRRRFSFEYNGMKNHEYYFEDISTYPKKIDPESDLAKKVNSQFGSFDNWISLMKEVAKTRGVGWAVTSYDKSSDILLVHWIDEQHLGQLNGASYILGIDMWEHSFVFDYLPSGKTKYIDDYFELVDFSFAEKRLAILL